MVQGCPNLSLKSNRELINKIGIKEFFRFWMDNENFRQNNLKERESIESNQDLTPEQREELLAETMTDQQMEEYITNEANNIESSSYYKNYINNQTANISLATFVSSNTGNLPVTQEHEEKLAKDWYNNLTTKEQVFENNTIIGRKEDYEVISTLAALLVSYQSNLEDKGVDLTKSMLNDNSPKSYLTQVLNNKKEQADEESKKRFDKVLSNIDKFYDKTKEFVNKTYGLTIDDDISKAENSQLSKAWDDKKVFTFSQKDNVNFQIKRLILTSPELQDLTYSIKENSDGSISKVYTNTNRATYLGLTKFLDFGKIFPYMQRNLAGSTNPQDMLSRLEVMSNIDPSIVNILEKVKASETLQAGLFTTFKFQSPLVNTFLVNDSKDELEIKQQYDNRKSRANFVIADDWTTNIISRLKEGKYPDSIKLEIKKVQTELTSAKDEDKISKASELANLLGITLIKSQLQKIVDNVDFKRYFTNPFISLIQKPLDHIVKFALDDKILHTNGKYTNVSNYLNQLALPVSTVNYDLSENSYLDVNGNVVYSFIQSNFLSDFFANIRAASDSFGETDIASKENKTALLNLLKSYRLEPAMKYSNWFGDNGLLIDEDGEWKLNNSFLRNFDYSYLGGLKNTVTTNGVQYDNMSNSDWHLTNLLQYINGDKKKHEWVWIPTPVPSDSGNIQYIRVPRISIGNSGKYNEDIAKIKDAIFNTVKQEISRIEEASKLIFDKDRLGNLTVKKDLDLTKLQKNYHYKKLDKEGKPILLENGIPTGNVFSFQNMSIKEDTIIEGKKKNIIVTLNDRKVGINGQYNFNESIYRGLHLDSEFNILVGEFIEDFIKQQVDNNISKIEEHRDKLKQLSEYKYYSDVYNENSLKDKTEEEKEWIVNGRFKNFVTEFVMNQYIHNVEQFNFFYGSIAEYKNALDTNKRAKEIISPSIRGYFKDNTYQAAVISDIILPSKDLQKIKDGVRQSLETTSNFNKEQLDTQVEKITNGYAKTNIGDAQGYMTLKRAKDVLVAYGKWNKVYQNLFDKINNGQDLTSSELEKTLEIFKPFYYGRAFDSFSGRMMSTQVKDAVIPLVPQLVRGTELEKLMNHMNDNKIDEVYFESAVKVGTTYIAPIANSDGTLKSNFGELIKAKPYFNSSYGIQQETPSHIVDYQNKLATQIQKIIIANLDSTGKTYHLGSDILTGNELVDHYFKIMDANLSHNYQELAKELNVNEQGFIDNPESLRSILTNEINRRGLSNNFLDAIKPVSEYDNSFKLPLFVSNMADKYESIALSLFDNNIINQKQPGGIGVLFSTAMLNKTTDTNVEGIQWLDKKNSDQTLRMSVSEDDKVTKVECLLPAWSKSLFNKQGNRININELDESIRTMIGFRIPTETKHSINVLEVVGFLPSSIGSTIVLPQEVVTQSGADFDIDKIFFLRKNLEIVNSKVQSVKYLDDSNSTIEDRAKALGIEKRVKNYESEKFFDYVKKALNKWEDKDGSKLSKSDKNLILSKYIGTSYDQINGRDIELINGARYNKAKDDNDYTLSDVVGTDDTFHIAVLKNIISDYNKQYDIESKVNEIKDLSIENQNTQEARQNRILDIYESILSNPRHYAELMTPSEFADMTADRDHQADLMGKAGAINPMTYEGQEEFRERNVSGRALKGLAVNAKGFSTIAQIAKIELRDDLAFEIRYKKPEAEALSKLKEKYGEDLSELDDSIIIKHRKLGFSPDGSFTNFSGELITDQHSKVVANVLDIVKDPVPYNINTYTFYVHSAMLMTGVPMRYANMYIAQPVLMDLAQNRFKSQGVFNNDSGSEFSKTKRQYLTNLYKILSGSGRISIEKKFEKAIAKGNLINPQRKDIEDLFGYNPDQTYIPNLARLESMIKLGSQVKKYRPEQIAKAKEGTIDNAISFYHNQLQLLETYNRKYKKTGEALKDGISVLNTDKLGVGPSLETVLDLKERMIKFITYPYDIEKTEDNDKYLGSRLLINGKPAITQIYKNNDFGFPELESNTNISSYPLLDSYFNHAYDPALSILQPIFIKNSTAFIRFRNSISTMIGTSLNDKATKKANDFANGYLAKDFSYFPDIEKEQVLGAGLELNLNLDVDLDTFKGLSAANQLFIIKNKNFEKLNGDIYHILNRLSPNISEQSIIDNGIHAIDFKNTISDHLIDDMITNSFNELFFSDDAFEQELGRNLLAYSFYTNKFNYNYNSYSKYTPSNLLAYIGYGQYLKEKGNNIMTDVHNILLSEDLIDKFVQNNWNDRNIVPIVYNKYKLNDKGKRILNDEFPGQEIYLMKEDTPEYNVLSNGILKVNKEELKNEGDKVANSNYLLLRQKKEDKFETTLFKRVENRDGILIYIPINKLGNKYTTEYTDDSISLFNNQEHNRNWYLNQIATEKQEQRISNQSIEDESITNQKVKDLQSTFSKIGINIKVEKDTNLNEIANVQDGIIKFNPNKIKSDTIYHEFGHVYVDLLGYNNPQIQAGINQLRGTELWSNIEQLYPELNQEQLEKEVLTTAIGIEADKIFKDNQSKAKWQIWLDNIFRAIAKLFGVNESVAKQLARELVTGNLQNTIQGQLSNEIQRQKDRTTLNSLNWQSEQLKKVAINLEKRINKVARSRKNPEYTKELKELQEEILIKDEAQALTNYSEFALRNISSIERRLNEYVGLDYKAYKELSLEDKDKFKSFILNAGESLSSLLEVQEFTNDELDANPEFNLAVNTIKQLEPRISSARNKRNELLKDIFNGQINELSSDPKYGGRGVVTSMREFSSPRIDESLTQLMLDAAGDSNDPILANLVKKYDYTMHSMNEEVHNTLRQYESEVEKLKKLGIDPSFVQEKIDGKFTGRIVSKLDYEKYYNERNEAFKKFNSLYVPGTVEHTREVAKWYEANTEANPRAKEIIEQKRIELTKSDFEDWYKNNHKETKKGEIIYTNELSQPISSKYTTDQFKDIVNNEDKLNFYNYINNLLSYLVSHHRDNIIKNGYLPAIPSRDFDLLKAVVGQIGWRDIGTPATDVEVNESGEIVRHVPFRYLTLQGNQSEYLPTNTDSQETNAANRIENEKIRKSNLEEHAKSIGHELDTIMKIFVHEALKNKYKNEIEDEVRIATELVNMSEYIKTNDANQALLDKISGVVKGGTPDVLTKVGSASNVAKHLEMWTKMVFYEDWKALEGDWVKIANVLQNYTSFGALGFNAIAGINNYVYGKMQMWTEGHGNQFISKTSLLKARKEYAKNMMNFIADMKTEKSRSLASALIKKFDIMISHKEVALDDGSKVSSVFHKFMMFNNFAYMFNHIGEHAMQNEMLLGMMMEHRIIDGKIVKFEDYLEDQYKKKGLEINAKDNNAQDILKQREELAKDLKTKFDEATSLYDAYELIEGFPVIKEGVEIGENEIADFRRKVLGVNQYLHGIYNKEDMNVIQHYALGRLASQFRKWMRPGWNRRFGSKFGKSFWNERRNMYDEGMYITTWNFLTNPIMNNVKNWKEDESMTALTAMKNIISDYKDYMTNVKVHWHSLNNTQRANVKRTFAEMSMLLGMICLGMILKGMRGDDDEKKHNRFWNWLGYQQSRSVLELSAYTPVGWFNESKQLIQNPAPIFTSFENILKLTYNVLQYPFVDEDKTVYKGGQYNGRNKIGVHAMKLVPGLNQAQRLYMLNQQSKAYGNFLY
ncbi:MAG: hypothetical protein JST04_00760 [Bdellovibrionales bacterium]|nr:hypothetical protein [Bdellovibrionales bacterium]